MYIDFKKLKEEVYMENVLDMLNLNLVRHEDQCRGPCPACNTGDNRALVVTDGKGWYCWNAKKGGDQIGLVAHIKGVSMKEAAKLIADHFCADKPITQPTVTPFKELDNLVFIHEKVQGLGINEHVAHYCGIGYCKQGIMRGRVVVPVRNKQGEILGYCGYDPQAFPPLKFPPNFEEQR